MRFVRFSLTINLILTLSINQFCVAQIYNSSLSACTGSGTRMAIFDISETGDRYWGIQHGSDIEFSNGTVAQALSPSGDRSSTIVKLDHNQQTLWKKEIYGASSWQYSPSANIIGLKSLDDELFVLLNTYSRVFLDGDTIGIQSQSNTYLLRFDNQGVLTGQALLPQGRNYDDHNKIELLDNGNLAILIASNTGYFYTLYTIDVQSLAILNQVQINDSWQSPAHLAVSGDTCYVAMNFEEDVTIDGTVIPYVGSMNNTAVVKFDSNLELTGNAVFNHSNCQIQDFEIANNRMALTGRFYGQLTEDGQTIAPNGTDDIYLAALELDGSNPFLTHITDHPYSANEMEIYAIEIDQNSLYVIMEGTHDTIYVNNQPIPDDPNSPNEFIVFRTTLNGDLLWFNQDESLYPSEIDIRKHGNSIFLVAGVDLINGSSAGSVTYDGVEIEACSDGLVLTELTNTSVVTGKCYVDVNSSSSYDLGDIVLPNRGVLVDTNVVFTDLNGDFRYVLSSLGEHVVSCPTEILHHQSPADVTIQNNSVGTIFNDINFAYDPIANVSDLESLIIPLTPVRPGFDVQHKVMVKNVGTTPAESDLSFVIPLGLEDVQAPLAQTVSLSEVNWQAETVNPYESLYFDVFSSLDSTISNGTILESYSYLDANDINIENDTFNLSQTVTGSYDPNDKLVFPESILLDALSEDTWIYYLIRFQNTGTDTAFTVRIVDNISSELKLESIQTILTSHSAQFGYTPQREVQWVFNDINLPDSSAGFTESSGFVYFRVKPILPVVDGRLENSASIYFDFNPPIITDTAFLHVVQLNDASLQVVETITQLVAFPNPASDQVILRYETQFKGQSHIEIRDMLGRLMQRVELRDNKGEIQLSTSELKSGIYICSLLSEGSLTRSTRLGINK